MLFIQKNLDGSLKTNRASHTADLSCDTCGTSASGVNMNSSSSYIGDCISMSCSVIGGTCNSNTSWPLTNGTSDAQEIALVKSA